jgi:hypothetical protein
MARFCVAMLVATTYSLASCSTITIDDSCISNDSENAVEHIAVTAIVPSSSVNLVSTHNSALPPHCSVQTPLDNNVVQDRPMPAQCCGLNTSLRSECRGWVNTPGPNVDPTCAPPKYLITQDMYDELSNKEAARQQVCPAGRLACLHSGGMGRLDYLRNDCGAEPQSLTLRATAPNTDSNTAGVRTQSTSHPYTGTPTTGAPPSNILPPHCVSQTPIYDWAYVIRPMPLVCCGLACSTRRECHGWVRTPSSNSDPTCDFRTKRPAFLDYPGLNDELSDEEAVRQQVCAAGRWACGHGPGGFGRLDYRRNWVDFQAELAATASILTVSPTAEPCATASIQCCATASIQWRVTPSTSVSTATIRETFEWIFPHSAEPDREGVYPHRVRPIDRSQLRWLGLPQHYEDFLSCWGTDTRSHSHCRTWHARGQNKYPRIRYIYDGHCKLVVSPESAAVAIPELTWREWICEYLWGPDSGCRPVDARVLPDRHWWDTEVCWKPTSAADIPYSMDVMAFLSADRCTRHSEAYGCELRASPDPTPTPGRASRCRLYDPPPRPTPYFIPPAADSFGQPMCYP